MHEILYLNENYGFILFNYCYIYYSFKAFRLFSDRIVWPIFNTYYTYMQVMHNKTSHSLLRHN